MSEKTSHFEKKTNPIIPTWVMVLALIVLFLVYLGIKIYAKVNETSNDAPPADTEQTQNQSSATVVNNEKTMRKFGFPPSGQLIMPCLKAGFKIYPIGKAGSVTITFPDNSTIHLEFGKYNDWGYKPDGQHIITRDNASVTEVDILNYWGESCN